MSSAPAIATHSGEYLLFEAAVPGTKQATIGVLLFDKDSDHALLRFRRDWEDLFVDAEDVEYFEALAQDLSVREEAIGGAALLAELESSLSHSVRVTDRDPVLVENWDKTLSRLYRTHVPAKVLQFRTHLPLYSARAAAGGFGEPMEVEAEDWVEAPKGLRLQKDMFVAHVAGRSMLPKILPDSLCIFRGGEALPGSREGKLVLVENHGEAGENRYTIKRYRSAKVSREDGSWEHGRILLEPLNPEFEAWELTPGRIEVRGIFIRVLE